MPPTPRSNFVSSRAPDLTPAIPTPAEVLHGGKEGVFQYNRIVSVASKTSDGLVSRPVNRAVSRYCRMTPYAVFRLAIPFGWLIQTPAMAN